MIARTAVGLESGPAMAKGTLLPRAKTIAISPALIRPNPTANGKVPASGPENMKAT